MARDTGTYISGTPGACGSFSFSEPEGDLAAQAGTCVAMPNTAGSCLRLWHE